ncbi:MAG: hypothetical protein EPN84_06405 [Legionella sp.]|nr:MAG: hypothetical protein EPN84_06405 [Legionella sp.]
MSKVVIIGAGPIGLYTALKLQKAGVKNIVICDLRAGEYTRPGHLNAKVFTEIGLKLRSDLGINRNGHIKEAERKLYALVEKLNISIIKKEFVGLNSEKNQKGVIVADQMGQEFIPCYHVFDCTGSKRAVINKVNELIPSKPFHIKQISMKVNFKRHLIAYVKFPEDMLLKLNDRCERTNATTLNYSASDYVPAMEKLQEFNWLEFGLPFCYGQYFGKGKACLYTECPDDLPVEKYEAWLQSAIKASLSRDLFTIQQLPSSKKYAHKSRQGSFEVNPKELEPLSYEGKDLPVVIALGDAQIDANYTLAHGILNGIDRTDALIQHLTVIEGEIVDFDAEAYTLKVKSLLDYHRNQIIEHYNDRSQYFIKWLSHAEAHYTKVIETTNDEIKKNQYVAKLEIIKARLQYHAIKKELEKPEAPAINSESLEKQYQELSAQFTRLKDIQTKLPQTLQREHEDLAALLEHIALSLKDQVGNQQFKLKQFEAALITYKHALVLLKDPGTKSTNTLNELAVISNTVQCLIALKRHQDAIDLAENTLESYPEDGEYKSLLVKIVFNTIKSYEQLLENAVDTESVSVVFALRQKVLDFCGKYWYLMNDQCKEQLLGIATLIKTAGSERFKTGQMDQASQFYKQALAIYQHHLFGRALLSEELAVISNNIHCARKLNLNQEVLSEAQQALVQYPDKPELRPLKKKILFNLLSACESLVKDATEAKHADFKQKIVALVKKCCDQNRVLMDAEFKKQAHALLVYFGMTNSINTGFFAQWTESSKGSDSNGTTLSYF